MLDNAEHVILCGQQAPLRSTLGDRNTNACRAVDIAGYRWIILKCCDPVGVGFAGNVPGFLPSPEARELDKNKPYKTVLARFESVLSRSEYMLYFHALDRFHAIT